MNSLSEIELLKQENERLYKVLGVNQIITGSLNLEFVLDTLMDKAKEVMDAEASSLMLLDEENEELYFHTVKGEKSDLLKTLRLKLGEGISGWVAREGKAVLIEDCSSDPRFYKKADDMSDFVTKTMMCVPLKVGKKILGTVQVLNKKNNHFFDVKDLKIFEITANQAAIAIENARLHKMATIDGMTGLFLKHYFMARLGEEYKRAKMKNVPVSLIMSDIDFFKKVNDKYGHQGGDAALVALAEVIRETVLDFGEECIPGRYGGEEFCVLMPETNSERAVELAEKIRKNVESRPIPIEDKEAMITISVGVSSYPVHNEFINNVEDFIKLADEALYLCKDRGRNCVALYEKV
ncbi:MAG: sensor domain-containing diguanylate cyclase [Spirochaetia bacterium]|nr:sensor domain-containing diguanylate cyclase [Spirochaetia bacterium]